MTAKLYVLYFRSCAVSPPCVNIFQSFGSTSLVCLVQQDDLSVSLVEHLLLSDHCDVFCWDQARDGRKKARFPLLGSPTRHITFSLCCLMRQFSSRILYSQKCAISISFRLLFKICSRIQDLAFKCVCSRRTPWEFLFQYLLLSRAQTRTFSGLLKSTICLLLRSSRTEYEAALRTHIVCHQVSLQLVQMLDDSILELSLLPSREIIFLTEQQC